MGSYIFIFLQLYFIDSPMLLVDATRVRNGLGWKYEWSKIKSWYIDKEQNYLVITISDDKLQCFHKIKSTDVDLLEDVMMKNNA